MKNSLHKYEYTYRKCVKNSLGFLCLISRLAKSRSTHVQARQRSARTRILSLMLIALTKHRNYKCRGFMENKCY